MIVVMTNKHFWYDRVEQKWKPKCKLCIEGLLHGSRTVNCPLNCKGDR